MHALNHLHARVNTLMAYNKPLPVIDDQIRPFWDAARDKKLSMQKCESCGHMHFPPSPVCPKCLGDSQTWEEVSGKGVLESWVDFHHVYWEGFRDSVPYRVCIVRLEEGPLLISNLAKEGGKAEPALGAPVHVVFDRVTDEVTLPKFALD